MLSYATDCLWLLFLSVPIRTLDCVFIILNYFILGIAVSSLLTPFPKTSISLFKHLTTIKYTQEVIRTNDLWLAAMDHYFNVTYSNDSFHAKSEYLSPRNFNREREFHIFSSLAPRRDRIGVHYCLHLFQWAMIQKLWNLIFLVAQDKSERCEGQSVCDGHAGKEWSVFWK